MEIGRVNSERKKEESEPRKGKDERGNERANERTDIRTAKKAKRVNTTKGKHKV